jgi:Holin of 3TMs, for gene-transfer release
MLVSNNKKEDWMNSKWRPAMGWMYMGVCIFDFVLAPVAWSLLQALSHGSVNTQWQPLTLQGAGLFHLAMGAVLGIAAYGRTQEKLGGASTGFAPNAGTTYVPPGGVTQTNINLGNQPPPMTMPSRPMTAVPRPTMPPVRSADDGLPEPPINPRHRDD